jgi:hypothetical protein
MSEQDNEATIQSVCVVIRTHMLDAAKEGILPLRRFDVFKDAAFAGSSSAGYGEALLRGAAAKDGSGGDVCKVPALSEVKEFFTLIFSKSQLESECIIIALIYCERLVKETRGRLCIRYDNWRSM